MTLLFDLFNLFLTMIVRFIFLTCMGELLARSCALFLFLYLFPINLSISFFSFYSLSYQCSYYVLILFFSHQKISYNPNIGRRCWRFCCGGSVGIFVTFSLSFVLSLKFFIELFISNNHNRSHFFHIYLPFFSTSFY